MKKTNLFITLVLIVFMMNAELMAQSMCGTTQSVSSTTPYKPTQSPIQEEYLKILIVYITFDDDNSDDPYNFWPKHQKPQLPGGGSLLAATEGDPGLPFMTRYPEYTYSDYFCQMSMGKLDIIGDEVFVDLPNSCDWYKNNSLYNNYGKLNKHILEDYVDPKPEYNFANYDNWKFENEQWEFEPDGKVDMIVMHYRRVPCDDNNWFFQQYAWGISDLGRDFFNNGLPITLDNKQIYGTWDHDGSGVTVNGRITHYLQNYSGVTNIVEHEISHHFFVNSLGNCASLIHSTLGLMTTSSDMTCFTMSPLERTQGILGGWIPQPEEITTDVTRILGDFISTGDVLKVMIPNTSEYFWVANHQKVSKYDGISRGSEICYNLNKGLQNFPECPVGKGLYIYHQEPPGCNSTVLEDADGQWNWVVNREVPWSVGWPPNSSIPLFEHTTRNIIDGNGEYIKLLNSTIYGQWVSDDRCSDSPYDYDITLDYWGDGLDAYNVGYDEIFSPYSNPATNSNINPTGNTEITIKVISQAPNGDITVKVYFNDESALRECPPSKPKNLKVTQEIINPLTGNFHPKLNWDRNREADFVTSEGLQIPPARYGIYRGSSIDCNVEPESFTLISTVPSNVTEYIDYSVILYPRNSGSGSCEFQFISYSYKISAVDNTNSESLLSDRSIINGYFNPCEEGDNIFSHNNNTLPIKFSIFNYPNPFNPATEIRYNIPKNALVKIKVYDIIGREIITLVNEFKSAGNYSVVFDGTNLPSGIYFYTLEAGDFIGTKKMVLLK